MDFKTRDITLHFQHIPIRLTLIDNIDELFNALIEKGETHPDFVDQRIPYWAELWASAVAMSAYLVENQQLIPPSVKTTEIGCGLGLPSIVAGKLGAEVCLTDYDTDALNFAKMNWEQNLPNKMARFQQLDWRNFDPSPMNRDASTVSADLLLASDVAYEERAFEPLLAAFKQLLKPNGTLLITEPNRAMFQPFLTRLNTEGYAAKHSERKVTLKEHEFLVNIYEIRKKIKNI